MYCTKDEPLLSTKALNRCIDDTWVRVVSQHFSSVLEFHVYVCVFKFYKQQRGEILSILESDKNSPTLNVSLHMWKKNISFCVYDVGLHECVKL